MIELDNIYPCIFLFDSKNVFFCKVRTIICQICRVHFYTASRYLTMDKTSWTYSTKYLLLAYIPRKRDVSKGNLGLYNMTQYYLHII